MSHAWRLSLLLMAVLCLAYRSAWSQGPASASAASAPALTLRIVFVSSQDEAQRVVERVRAGENVAVLAKTLSIDPTANDGGLIGPIDPSTLRPELRDALQGRHAGDIAPIITIPTGFAIVQIVSEHAREESWNAGPLAHASR
jgi:parvulin-like peptidyl-prolyl isomerase